MPQNHFPKIDLHLHLDGSFRLQTLWELAKQRHISMPTQTPEDFDLWIRRHAEARSVNEYLKMFAYPLAVMQDEESITRITKELVADLQQQGLSYAEIRFAPQLHTRLGLTQEEVLLAVLKGLHAPHSIPVGIITCMMSIGDAASNYGANMETVELCNRYIGKGVVAIDLAGAEGIVPLSAFKPLFTKARAYHLPMTCHAGDSQHADTVRDAIGFGVTRIGHGHHIIEDETLCHYAKEHHITLEICPTSNVQCMTVPSYEKHPVRELFKKGVPVTINTDNMTLAHTTLKEEYEHCRKEMHFNDEELRQMSLYAIDAAFAPKEIKEQLRQQMKGDL